MFRLDRLTLKGFKSIRAVEDLELRELNVLIGPNGAGKSNLLSFFRMLGALSQQRLQLFVGKEGGANAVLHHGRKRTPEIQAKVSWTSGDRTIGYAVTLAAAAPDNLVVTNEELTIAPFLGMGGTTARSRQGGSNREAASFLNTVEGGPEHCLLQAIAGLTHYHFHDTSAAALIRQGAQTQDNRSLREDGGNLAAFLHMLKSAHREHYERIRDTIRLAAPFFDDFALEPSALNPNTIALEWRERDSDATFYAHHLSDGTLRFMALTAALLQPDHPGRPRTIFIDEPELGLHPYAITLLAAMMRAASKSVQLVVSTQSVTLLDALAEPEDVIVVGRDKRNGGASTFERLDPEKLASWLEEYSLGELWEKNVLGGRP